MISYYQLGGNKKLNEIVFAGSHDAAITQGGGNAKTQDLDIHGQASAGVRLFDIRITGSILKKGESDKVLALRAYHGTGSKKVQTGLDLRTGNRTDLSVKSMSGGTYGLTLSKILTDAAKFVKENDTEFLILKFDKCDNWGAIAEACVDLLGDTIFRTRGNVNLRTLRELRGKVVVLFSKAGQAATGLDNPVRHGILVFQNLKGGGGFDQDFDGLQYFGKGGTSILKPFSKISQNVKKQSSLMRKGIGCGPEVMGMMYWTTTGVFESIRQRNDTMWTKVKRESLKKMWTNGLYESIQERMSSAMNGRVHSNGPVLKAFMPNIVMIDFADEGKCKTIYELNVVASVDLTDVATVLEPFLLTA
ncbi:MULTISPECIES: hypothetical protein [unclassified Luteimonas]